MTTDVSSISPEPSCIPSDPQNQTKMQLQIQKIVSDAMIILSALVFIGAIVTRWFIVPITLSSLSIIGACVITMFTTGLILRTKQDSDPLEDIPFFDPKNNLNDTISSFEEPLGTSTEPSISQIEKIFNHDPTQIHYFLTNRLTLSLSMLTLGKSFFDKKLIEALALGEKLDKIAPFWDRQRIEQPSSLTPSVSGFDIQIDPQDITSLPKGLSNPGRNCFMHASLQAVFQDQTFSSAILSQLKTIAESDQYNQPMPLFDKTTTIICTNQDEKSDLLEHKDEAIQALQKTCPLLTIKPFASYAFSEISKLNFYDINNLINVFITCSFKQAADYSYNLLSQWQNGSMLSANESILLRLSLIKLMNRPSTIRLSKTTTSSATTYTADLILPGINTDFSINPSSDEDASLFIINVLESLDHLSHSISPSIAPAPHMISIQRQIQAYKLPQTEDGVTACDPSLIIEGAHAQYTQRLSVHHPESTSYNFKLNDLSFLNPYRSHTKKAVTYKSGENLPSTNIGDTVSETYEYKVIMPQKLITSLKIFDYSQLQSVKHRTTRVTFTDETNLTITFSKQDFFDQDLTYKLDSFIVHNGYSLRSGHYFTYTRVKSKVDQSYFWIKQNDGTVEPCHPHEPLSILKGGQAYINPVVLIFSKV